ncbi:uncharacterized protein LOC126204177 [Schistocerca nitens]|uniref:uncharacterized protein LOC126204177 n=1 Tax=Schistocerca nitens TaxID=7011 RepID=UPI00211985C1|nr:uncharacterized protein LOC126204177 [Schistocerca nitens]
MIISDIKWVLDLQTLDKKQKEEWEWEQWALPPTTFNATESAAYRGPGPRVGASLWRDRAGRSWWLFGGRQRAAHAGDVLKVYSDLWRYDVAETRRWSRVFPSDDGRAKASGIVMLRAWLQSAFAAGNRSGIVLCGRSEARRPEDRSLAVYGARSGRSDTVWQMELKDGLWTAYVCCCDSTDRSDEGHPRRHRGQDPKEFPRAALPDDDDNNTQDDDEIIMKTTQYPVLERRDNALPGTRGTNASAVEEHTGPWIEQQRPSLAPRNREERPPVKDSAGTEEGAEAGAEEKEAAEWRARPGKRPPGSVQPAPLLPPSDRSRSPPPPPPPKKKQTTTPSPPHTVADSRVAADGGHGASTTTVASAVTGARTTPPPPTPSSVSRGATTATSSSAATPTRQSTAATTPADCEFSDEDEPPPCAHHQRPEAAPAPLPRPPQPQQQQQAFCPDFDSQERSGAPGAQPIAWCDTRRELLAALDLRGSPLRLWQFDLRTSHWTQHQVLVENGSLWPGCADGSARHASSGDAVYVVCAPYGSSFPTSTRLVYQLWGATGAGPGAIRALGQLQLDAAFEEPAGADIWMDETRTVLQVTTVPTEDSGHGLSDGANTYFDEDCGDCQLCLEEVTPTTSFACTILAGEIGGSRTLLLVAYKDTVHLWLRERTGGFWPVELKWQGAAYKWFRSFSSPLYHFSIMGHPWVIPNPRDLQAQDYWPVERGRFVVRIVDTSDANASPHGAGDVHVAPPPALPPPPSLHVSPPLAQPPAQPSNGVKAIVFFGLSLSIFSVFGAAVFVRRCVTCPPARRDADSKGVGGLAGVGLGGGSSNQAPVVRYSAIPDDLGYPAA